MNWIKVPHGKRRSRFGLIKGILFAFLLMGTLAFVPALLAYGENLPERAPYVQPSHSVLDGMSSCDSESGHSDVYPCYWDKDAHGGRHGLGTPRYVLWYGPGLPYEWWGGREG